MSAELPSVHGEEQLSHSYADERLFSMRNLMQRAERWETVRERGELSTRALGQLAIITDRLQFEIQARIDDLARQGIVFVDLSPT